MRKVFANSGREHLAEPFTLFHAFILSPSLSHSFPLYNFVLSSEEKIGSNFFRVNFFSLCFSQVKQRRAKCNRKYFFKKLIYVNFLGNLFSIRISLVSACRCANIEKKPY